MSQTSSDNESGPILLIYLTKDATVGIIYLTTEDFVCEDISAGFRSHTLSGQACAPLAIFCGDHECMLSYHGANDSGLYYDIVKKNINGSNFSFDQPCKV